ncbi:MAG: PEP-CTERM sorting domain-containing protein [Candidatus Sulfotelmatobacter sp.]
MSDPAGEDVPVVRRRSRRHRRNRLIRRWLALATVILFSFGASTLALHYLSPSLFRAQQSTAPDFQQAEFSRDRVITLNQLLTHTEPSSDRPVYPYSLVPGGVEDAKELKWVAEHDPIVAAHYAGFDYDHAKVVRLTLDQTVYLSFRIGNHVYWTRHRVTLHRGEKLLTDGRMTARTRCANRVEDVPQQAAAPVEPPAVEFDQKIGFPVATAMHTPPVPFESALLKGPGLGSMGPLSLYDPLPVGNLISISPPPLPQALCGPNRKKDAPEGCCAGEEGIGKKKQGSPCGGGTGTVPEPSTWVMFVSGLAAISWQARRKLSRAPDAA